MYPVALFIELSSFESIFLRRIFFFFSLSSSAIAGAEKIPFKIINVIMMKVEIDLKKEGKLFINIIFSKF
jgi:hypothetical protein